MAESGYLYKGENGIPGRRYFRKGSDERHTHHIHIYRGGPSRDSPPSQTFVTTCASIRRKPHAYSQLKDSSGPTIYQRSQKLHEQQNILYWQGRDESPPMARKTDNNMSIQKLSKQEFEIVNEAQPAPIDPSATAAGSTVVSLLSSLDRKVLDQVMIEHRYSPGEVVVHEGRYGDIAYLIWSGRVAVVQGPFANPTSVNYRGPGEVVGEMSLIDNKPRSASLVALDEVRLLGIYRDDFFELLQIDPNFSTNMMEILSRRSAGRRGNVAGQYGHWPRAER